MTEPTPGRVTREFGGPVSPAELRATFFSARNVAHAPWNLLTTGSPSHGIPWSVAQVDMATGEHSHVRTIGMSRLEAQAWLRGYIAGKLEHRSE